MIAVADTSPLNYLVLIGQDALLPALFGRVCVPSAVLTELQSHKAPPEVKAWSDKPPV